MHSAAHPNITPAAASCHRPFCHRSRIIPATKEINPSQPVASGFDCHLLPPGPPRIFTAAAEAAVVVIVKVVVATVLFEVSATLEGLKLQLASAGSCEHAVGVSVALPLNP